MAWIDNKKDFNTGIKMYLFFMIPEALLLMNFPLNSAIMRVGMGAKPEEISKALTSGFSMVILGAFLALFTYRIYLVLLNSKKTNSEFLVSHSKWLSKTILTYVGVLIVCGTSLYYIISNIIETGIMKDYMLPALFILMVSIGINCLYFMYKEIYGFSKFMSFEKV